MGRHIPIRLPTEQQVWSHLRGKMEWIFTFFVLRHVVFAKQLGTPVQLSHLQEGCTTFAQGRKPHTELSGCAIPLLLLLMPREVGTQHQTYPRWMNQCNEWQQGHCSELNFCCLTLLQAFGYPSSLTFYCFCSPLGARIFKAKINVIFRWARKGVFPGLV